MPVAEVEAVLRAQFELLQYAAFFGVFAIFALIEGMAPRDPAQPMRWRRWPTNWVLTALNIVVMGAVPVSAIAVADWAGTHRFGLINAVELPLWAAITAGFLGRAFLSWGMHILNHKVPLFWAVHRVHHADTRLDVSTTVRFHPLEFVYSTPITLAGMALIGVPPIAALVYEVMDAAITVFSHANVRLPRWLDYSLRLIIVTPDVHRVHHSSYHAETDSNYGAVLTIWDRVLGTYRSKPADALAAQETGLGECQDSRSRSLMWLLILPFIELRERAARSMTFARGKEA